MSGTAYSIDGRAFWFETALARAMAVGTYVTITVDDRIFLGQVLEESVVQVPVASQVEGGPRHFVAGRGNLLATMGTGVPGKLDGDLLFDGGSVDQAPADLVAQHFAASRGSTSGIELGDVQGVPGLPATLQAKGFGRHTFLCGQSGSGKTYTLGIVLERMLLDTDIKIAVIDPNSDFVNLGTMRPQADVGLSDEAYRELKARYEAATTGLHVYGGASAPHKLLAWYGHLTPEQQTMVLGLDPIKDSAEYNAFLRTIRRLGTLDYSLHDVLAATQASFDETSRRLGQRIDNLGVADLSIWASEGELPIRDTLPDDWRMLVADLGSLASTREGSIAAAAILGNLWEQRHARNPLLIVIDEAHNVCPQHPMTANQALATEHVVRIAGEGRKYGLYLLLSTQRPEKVHQNVLSQCDNLILMKMNSANDIRSLTETFSYAPPALIAQASSFGLGEGLAVGKIAPDPLLFQSGRRLSEEGGTDVPASWAAQR